MKAGRIIVQFVWMLLLSGCAGEADAATDAALQPDADASMEDGGVFAADALPDVGSTGPLAIVDHLAWQVSEAGTDPFGDRPEDPACDPKGAREELGTFEVETGLCTYLTASQPSLEAIAPGDTLDIEIWHLQLASLEPAEAHVAVRIGAHIVFDERVPIPGPANNLSRSITADFGADAGTPVFIHLHNHGYNSWKFGAMRVHRPN